MRGRAGTLPCCVCPPARVELLSFVMLSPSRTDAAQGDASQVGAPWGALQGGELKVSVAALLGWFRNPRFDFSQIDVNLEHTRKEQAAIDAIVSERKRFKEEVRTVLSRVSVWRALLVSPLFSGFPARVKRRYHYLPKLQEIHGP